MSLNDKAGLKKPVSGAARNLPYELFEEAKLSPKPLSSDLDSEANVLANALSTRSLEAAIPSIPKKMKSSDVSKKEERLRKVSFFCNSDREAKFRKARMRAGIETLEEAYNLALERFISDVEKGLIEHI